MPGLSRLHTNLQACGERERERERVREREIRLVCVSISLDERESVKISRGSA